MKPALAAAFGGCLPYRIPSCQNLKQTSSYEFVDHAVFAVKM